MATHTFLGPQLCKNWKAQPADLSIPTRACPALPSQFILLCSLFQWFMSVLPLVCIKPSLVDCDKKYTHQGLHCEPALESVRWTTAGIHGVTSDRGCRKPEPATLTYLILEAKIDGELATHTKPNPTQLPKAK